MKFQINAFESGDTIFEQKFNEVNSRNMRRKFNDFLLYIGAEIYLQKRKGQND